MNNYIIEFGAVLSPHLAQLPSGLLGLVPSYLAVFIVVLAVMTGIAMLMRLAVYQYLMSLRDRVRRLVPNDNSTHKPKIVEEIEKRFQEFLPNLEKINSGAVIDRAYSQYLAGTEWRDYFARSLPNLLLALGLLGTFFGITINLTELSQTINEFGAGNIDELVQQVQRPLQGMGVAFISSLTAVFCSAVLTGFNLLQNTTLAKSHLLSALEDYADNIYLPSLGHRAPLEMAADRIEGSLERLAGALGVALKEAVETSLAGQINQIVEENKQANHLATQVYSRFQESANAMMSGATIFRESANIFERSQFAQKLSTSTESLAHTIRELSRSAAVLNQASSTSNLAITSLQNSNEEMIRLGKEVAAVNAQSSQVLALTEGNQKSLADVVMQLQQATQIFHSVIRTLDLLQKRLDTRGDKLMNVQGELSALVEALKNYTEEMAVGMQNMGDRLVLAINQQGSLTNSAPVEARITSLNQELKTVRAQLAQVVQSLSLRSSAPTRPSLPPNTTASEPENPIDDDKSE
ncbi:hypothetical protein [[Phormidium] sp. ETS-05]|uniref:hypothetical protein n=1 Tax=[Phormidium] sp. ETS-05 TaxID=222819 RepID=UPI0018EF053F|nr:hypothetical protein [[Phormidium] sp. ETS-05]